MFQKILLIVFLNTVPLISGLLVENLGGIWILNDENGVYINLTAEVPGGIYTDLEKNKIIGDVFFGTNDVQTRWVSLRNWTYSLQFLANEDLLNYSNKNLVFDGVDTFATIYLNDVEIGSTDNMFVQYIFDINNNLKAGVNHLKVAFESPVNKAKKLFEEQSQSYTVVPTCVPNEYQGECHANHVRKMQASFSWDWGPAFPSMGIWKNVSMEVYNSSRIRDITINTIPNNNTASWDIYMKTYFAKGSKNIKGTLSVKLYTDVGTQLNKFDIDIMPNEDGEYVTSTIISVPQLQVKRWWPNGYGNATLYQFEVAFVSEDKVDEDIKKMKIGFRTIELDQHEYPSGRAFYFIVNGIPIFAKGSNSIPLNVLPERGQNISTIRFLLESAKDVNMNMLRVWGGGVYESDDFYNVADELGILIWQDFMFACSMYPTTSAFLETVSKEVQHQVRRLQHHPSIAIWAGNNENEAALRQNWYGTANNFTLYKQDFIKLYVDTIKPIVLKNDDSRNYLTSSPTNGIQSEDEDYIAQNPQSHFYGDVHFYNYIKDSWDANIYPIPRFASEYGYQSLPELEVLKTITDNITDLGINSDFMNHRQHHFLGYLEMTMLMNHRLLAPTTDDFENKLKGYIYYFQILQAMAIKIETEYYRRWKNFEDEIGQGFTMGALYWQLNDVWVAPTWAGIVFNLNWKMLHYYAKDFFAPMIITSHLKLNRDLSIFIVNDKLSFHFNLTTKVSVYKWNNFTALDTNNINVPSVSENNGVEVANMWIDKYLENAGCGDLNTSKHNCFIYLEVYDADGQKCTPDNYVFPSPLKEVDIQSPNITIESITAEEMETKIVIRSDIPALFVWLDSGSVRGRFSENGFHMITEAKEVYFYPEQSTDSFIVSEVLQVTNLMNPMYFN